MKRIYSFIAAALTMMTAASCVQELGNDGQLQEGAVVYKAVAEGADTKAVLGTNEAGRPQSMWEDGDKIYIQTGNWNFYTFTTSLSEPSPVADFTYTGTDDFEIPAGNAVIATHPYINLINLEERYVSFDIPVSQKAGQDVESYDQAAVTVVAYSKNRTLNFKNTSALLKCKVGLSDVAKIRFYGLNDEAVAGSAIAVMKENGEIDNIGVLGGNEYSVELSDASGGALLSSWNYYISIIPNTFASGFGIELLNAEGEVVFTKQYDKSITIERNTILDLGTLGGSSDIEPSDGDYIDEYGINHGPGVEINGVVWAPVNCGYHAEDFKYGKLYQWGRKYGQGYDSPWDHTYSDSIVPTTSQGSVDLATGQSEANANIFFYQPVSPFDWCTTQDYPLWNVGTDKAPVKSEYDPCPDGWRVPTSSELAALSSNYSSWTTIDGQNGRWFSGTVSYTSEVPQIFLSATGYLDGDNGYGLNRSKGGNYWSCGTSQKMAYNLDIASSYAYYHTAGRASGFSVRCVKDDSDLIAVENITLDKTELSLEEGETYTLTSSITPSTANHKSAHWYSDNSAIVSVNQNGQLTAKSSGTTTITAMAGMQKATCHVTVVSSVPSESDYIDEYGINHGPGVSINGVVWAPVNCGYHAEDFKYGKLYQWGRKYGQGYIGGSFADAVLPELKAAPVSLAEGQAAENENVFFNIKMPDSFRGNNWSDGEQSGLWNSGTEHSPIKTEYDPCPDGWRVPTSAEMSSLESVTYSWIRESQPEYNGVYGTVVADDSGLREAFFPASGYLSCSDASGIDRGRTHLYSTSNYNDGYRGCEIGSIFGTPYARYSESAFGYSVRCVQDESPLVKVESLTINTTSVSMTEGETCTISAEVFPSDANQNTALWYSDTPSVATVDKYGTIKAISVGTARIIAMAGMKSAECVVTVKESPFIGTWKGTMSGYYRQAIYQDVTFTVAADPEGGLTVSAGINPYFIINGIEDAVYRAEIEGNQLVVSSQQQVGYDDVILVGFNHADPAAATENDHIRFIMNEDGTLSQPYAFGAYTESGGGWYEIYPGGGTFKKEKNSIEDMPEIEL